MEQTRTERTLDEIRQAIKGLAGDEATMETETVKAGSRRLEVTVMSARHLPKMDTFGSIDPFCEVRLGAVAFKTTVRKNTYTPEWSETFTFQMLDSTTAGQPLKIALYDWDMVGDNSRVGLTEISAEKIAELMGGEVGCFIDEALNVQDDTGQTLIGKDKKAAVVQLRLRVLDGLRIPYAAGTGSRGPASVSGRGSTRFLSAGALSSAGYVNSAQTVSDSASVEACGRLVSSTGVNTGMRINSTTASLAADDFTSLRLGSAGSSEDIACKPTARRRFSVGASIVDSNVLNKLTSIGESTNESPALDTMPQASTCLDQETVRMVDAAVNSSSYTIRRAGADHNLQPPPQGLSSSKMPPKSQCQSKLLGVFDIKGQPLPFQVCASNVVLNGGNECRSSEVVTVDSYPASGSDETVISAVARMATDVIEEVLQVFSSIHLFSLCLSCPPLKGS